MLSNAEYTIKNENKISLDFITDYSTILDAAGLKYKKEPYYWQVGEMKTTQGWIIHLSVVLYQVLDLLTEVIPLLASEKIPFKIIMNETTVEDLLNGELGLAQIGKIVSIYPENVSNALSLAKKLIESTKSYKGPSIPTDICLSNIVYTRFGSFNPIIKLNTNGEEEKYIYDGLGNLIKDSYSIPFQVPNGVPWPFDELAKLALPGPPKLLNHIYKPIELLKADPKGNVFRGLYVKSLFQVKPCVIKQGFLNMYSDKFGRDIHDRLLWQTELYKALSDIIPLPIIYDLFQEEGHTVLVMELIKGDSLFDKLIEKNPLSKTWKDISPSDIQLLLKYAVEITQIIGRMHIRGYVHRDINPVNFIIDKKDKITLIDIELAYSLKENKPDPPFTLGTFGFMSPEQAAIQRPTVHEDIYALGATLVYLFTGLLPIKFNSKDTTSLYTSLHFFIDNKDVAKILATSLHPDLKLRPPITDILASLKHFQHTLHSNLNSVANERPFEIQEADKVLNTISSALVGLTDPPMIIKNNVWYSKQLTVENFTARQNKQYAINPSISEGICGVLYMLARLHSSGISITQCNIQYVKSWALLKETYFSDLSRTSMGLYRGAAGFALTLAENISSGLFDNSDFYRTTIERCLNLSTESLDLANGISGQGLSALRCRNLLTEGFCEPYLETVVATLLKKQNKNGLWLDADQSNNRKKRKIYNIGYDDTGIIWFLLDYLSFYPDTKIQSAVTKALNAILNNKACMKDFNNLVASNESYELGDGGKGLIATIIKAYETLHEGYYKKIAEIILSKYPRRVIHNNFSQENGLAALGELYLEAWRVFKNENWKNCADWISNVFIHSFFRTDDTSGYWVMEQNNPPTASFLSGISGIIHFLARNQNSDKIGYRILK